MITAKKNPMINGTFITSKTMKKKRENTFQN